MPLNWSDSNCVTKYKILVRVGSQTGEQVVKKKVTVSEYLTDPLTAGKTYHWRIKACNGKNCAASAWGKFKVNKNAQ